MGRPSLTEIGEAALTGAGKNRPDHRWYFVGGADAEVIVIGIKRVAAGNAAFIRAADTAHISMAAVIW